MTAPVIPTLPAAPSRNDAPDTFVAKADAHVAALTPWTSSANSFGTYMDSLASGVDADAATATTQAGIATTQAGNAATSATLAQDWANKTTGTVSGGEYSAKKYAQDSAASAAAAILTPGTQATSSTSMSIGTGSKSFTLDQTGKNFVVGQWVSITDTSNPSANWMTGAITAFNSGTGAITVNVVNRYGSGTIGNWTIIPSTPVSRVGTSIGGIKFSRDLGTVISPTDTDPTTYLRSGTVATAATYPNGVLVDYLKAYGSANVSLGQYIGDWATDGNLTIVCTYGSTNVLVSTDGGASWSTVASNLASSALASSVCWTGSRFIVSGHAGGSSVYLAYSATGSSFTAGATIGFATGASAGATSIRWDGTIALVAVRNGIADCTATTTDGTDSTQRALPGGLSSDPRVAVLPANGANRWVVAMTGSDSSYRSVAADGSGTWVFQNGPTVSGAKSFVATGSKYVVGSGTNIYYSSTGATGSWTTVALPLINNFVGVLNINSNNSLHYNGTRLWVGSNLGTSTTTYSNAVAYTTDLTTFATWTQIQATFPIAGQATYGANIAPAICGARLLFLPADGLTSGSGSGHSATVSASYSPAWATSADYVGHSLPLTLNTNGTQATDRYFGYLAVA